LGKLFLIAIIAIGAFIYLNRGKSVKQLMNPMTSSGSRSSSGQTAGGADSEVAVYRDADGELVPPSSKGLSVSDYQKQYAEYERLKNKHNIKAKVLNKKSRKPIFGPRTCLAMKKQDYWEFSKVVKVKGEAYVVKDCHRYKGCGAEQDVPFADLEFEYRRGQMVECIR
jgi:hypothetical protein